MSTVSHTLAGFLFLAACLHANGADRSDAGTNVTLTQRPVPTMHISFERSGGVAGMRLAVSIDSDTLPGSQATELQKLVADARFFDQPAGPQPAPPGADQFLYRITVEAQGRRHTVETNEAAAAGELKPLLQWLSRAARRPRGGTP